MSNTIRSLATLPSRYSWKSAPSNSTRLPGRRDARRVDRPGVGAGAPPPGGGPGAVVRHERRADRLELEVGERAPGLLEEPAHVVLAAHGLRRRPSRRRRCRRSSGRARGRARGSSTRPPSARRTPLPRLCRPSLLQSCADPTGRGARCPTAARTRPRCARPRRRTRRAAGASTPSGEVPRNRSSANSAASSPAITSSGASQPGASLPVAAVVTSGASRPARRRRVGGLRARAARAPWPSPRRRRRRCRRPTRGRHGLELARVAAAGAAAHAAALAAGRELVGEAGGVLLDVGRQAVEAVAQLLVGVAAGVDACRCGGSRRAGRRAAAGASGEAGEQSYAEGLAHPRGTVARRSSHNARRWPPPPPARARPLAPARPPRRHAARAPPPSAPALVVASLYAAFASGAIGVSEQSRLQLIVAVDRLRHARRAAVRARPALHALARRAAGRGAAGRRSPRWCALSITWSMAPDQSWLEANRAISYALVAALAIALGSSLPRAAERVGARATWRSPPLIALYALGGKLFPWLDIPGLIDLNHTERFSRLRAPLDYWNALALVCVMAVPVAVRAGADLGGSARLRLATTLALVPLLTTIALTYSRGGLLCLAAALALLIGIGPERLRLAATAGGRAGRRGAADPARVLQRRPHHRRPAACPTAVDDGLLFLARRRRRAGDRLRARAQADRARASGWCSARRARAGRSAPRWWRRSRSRWSRSPRSRSRTAA